MRFLSTRIRQRWIVFTTILVVTCGLLAFLVNPSHPSAQEHSFRPALPGYEYHFPSDHGSHDDFQTEWWYYTGHLLSADRHRYGYQLTFFRRAIASEPVRRNPSRWATRNIYFAHFAVTDEDHGTFRFSEKMSRGALGAAGAETGRLAVWIDDWRAHGNATGHVLHAGDEGRVLDLTLTPEKEPVVHGHQGVSRKGERDDQTSHYYSFTRMKSQGTLVLDGQAIPVTGLSWMDHEFGTNQLREEQVGWDWFSLQMQDHSELMFYQIRRQDGSVEPASAGTWIPTEGAGLALKREEVQIDVLEHWRSPQSGARYPARWRIAVPSVKLVVELTPTVSGQELVTQSSTQVTYWEGSVTVTGTREGRAVSGTGYAELTGYAAALRGRL
jgi:predicted secreted hydrolase